MEGQIACRSIYIYRIYSKHRPVKIPNHVVQEIYGKRDDNSSTFTVFQQKTGIVNKKRKYVIIFETRDLSGGKWGRSYCRGNIVIKEAPSFCVVLLGPIPPT
jgi:hypothetical protein